LILKEEVIFISHILETGERKSKLAIFIVFALEHILLICVYLTRKVVKLLPDWTNVY